MSARSQLLRGVEPIFLRRSFRTASSSPEFVGQGRDVVVSERVETVRRRRLSVPASVWGMLRGLPRTLVCRQVILLSLLFAHPMSMRGTVM